MAHKGSTAARSLVFITNLESVAPGITPAGNRLKAHAHTAHAGGLNRGRFEAAGRARR